MIPLPHSTSTMVHTVCLLDKNHKTWQTHTLLLGRERLMGQNNEGSKTKWFIKYSDIDTIVPNGECNPSKEPNKVFLTIKTTKGNAIDVRTKCAEERERIVSDLKDKMKGFRERMKAWISCGSQESSDVPANLSKPEGKNWKNLDGSSPGPAPVHSFPEEIKDRLIQHQNYREKESELMRRLRMLKCVVQQKQRRDSKKQTTFEQNEWHRRAMTLDKVITTLHPQQGEAPHVPAPSTPFRPNPIVPHGEPIQPTSMPQMNSSTPNSRCSYDNSRGYYVSQGGTMSIHTPTADFSNVKPQNSAQWNMAHYNSQQSEVNPMNSLLQANSRIPFQWQTQGTQFHNYGQNIPNANASQSTMDFSRDSEWTDLHQHIGQMRNTIQNLKHQSSSRFW